MYKKKLKAFFHIYIPQNILIHCFILFRLYGFFNILIRNIVYYSYYFLLSESSLPLSYLKRINLQKTHYL